MYPPLKVPGLTSWSQRFLQQLSVSSDVQVVTGYASEASISELVNLISTAGTQFPKLKSFSFFLGMAFFEGLTARQKKVLSELNSRLISTNLGKVYIPTDISVHSKAAIFQVGGSYRLTVGSSNFSALLPIRRSELDIFIDEDKEAIGRAVDYFSLLRKASLPLDSNLLNAISTVKTVNSRLQGAEVVSTYDTSQFSDSPWTASFDLPVKPTGKSNLNKYLAKPRGKVPRNWYEVEINVPTEIGTAKGFPSAKTGDRDFMVFTHDGFMFPCHVSGGNLPHLNKNFESSKDLKVLGYWIKGHLVSSGVLNEGDPVLESTLLEYGRSHVTIKKIGSKDNSWFIDFERSAK
jgi:hypothetical protein